MSRSPRIRLAAAALSLSVVAAVQTAAQHQHPGPPAGAAAAPARHVTMEELHAQGGVPRGWRFTLPAGEPTRGRQVFIELECFKCHRVRNETFGAPDSDPAHAGPELTGMGAMHPAEYFAESILAPNQVIVDGPGYTGPDGLSIMPSFAESLTVTQLIDLVSYLKSLTSGGESHAAHMPGQERTAGDYRIRLLFAGETHGHPGGHEHHDAAAPAARTGRLMAFVADRETSEPVPYLPVSATFQAAGRGLRRVRLSPMIDRRGFHYGVTITLPPHVDRITVEVGAATIPVMDGRRFKLPVSAVFEWPAS